MKMTYREILNQEFIYRKKLDSNYSLRTYAKEIGLSPSHLSDVLKFKRGISENTATIISQRINLNDNKAKYFIALVNREHGRSKKVKREAENFLQTYKNKPSFKLIEKDKFDIIADWYYFAILECLEIKDYDGSPLFISQKLNLPIETTLNALKKLESLNLIKKEAGIYISTKIILKTTQDIESKALKVSHKQTLTQSIKALDSVPVQDRDFTSITMAIDKSKLAEAKEKIKKFRRELCEFLEDGNKEEVYNLNIQLLPTGIGEN